jgi:hypothetical protein
MSHNTMGEGGAGKNMDTLKKEENTALHGE